MDSSPIVSAALLQPASHGPGADLVALNWRRFERDHRRDPIRYKPNNPHVVVREHSIGGDEDTHFARGQMIEAKLAAIPERLLSRLPEETAHQLIESFARDPALMDFQPHANPALTKQMIAMAQAEEDPDSASIERLTKSCLTVQASSLPADQLNVTFHLYTRRNLRQAFVMGPQVSREQILSGSPFLAAGRPIKWITHGFHTNLDKSEWMLEAKDKILAFEDANVIMTDWRRGSTPALAFYPKAAANAHVVAKMIIKILRRIRNDIDLGQVHLIGHSLGAHIMGFVGGAFTEEYLRRQQQHLAASAQEKTRPTSASAAPLNPAGQLIGRITACDPALPCFGSSSSAPNSRGGAPSTAAAAAATTKDTHGRQRRQAGPAASYQFMPAPPPADDWTPVLWTHLRPDSALLVEVIHSNPGVMGYAEPLGDFDFFPNGSERQPGCSNGGHTSSGDGPAAGAGSAHLRFARHAPKGSSVASGSPPQATPPDPQSKPTETPRSGSTKSIARASLPGFAALSKTLSQFIKPIRDFFLAYTCSHHRSVEYMVESLYYELVPPERRLDPEYVCQMVGYRCSSYESFKRGFCFACRDQMECRAFGQSAVLPLVPTAAGSSQVNGSSWGKLQPISQPASYTQTLAGQFAGLPDGKEQASAQSVNVMAPDERSRRTMPTTTYQYRQNYKPAMRNQYYFDTRGAQHGASFCLHHYHLLVKYRWFRIRGSVQVERFRLLGSINDFSSFVSADSAKSKDSAPSPQDQPTHKFYKFTQHAYTMLLTTPDFLGRLETLLVYGDSLKPNLIEHIEISYLSNLDPQVRAASSARLCLSSSQPMDGQQRAELAHWLGVDSQKSRNKEDQQDSRVHLFVRCPTADLAR